MTECEKCGYEFNYNDPSATRSYYRIEKRSEAIHGQRGMVAYCIGCAPFGNTKIPGKLD